MAEAGRPQLTRERIIDQALEIIESDGLKAFSMRSLAAPLQVEAMSLYRYVDGREGVLDAVTDRLMYKLDEDPDVLESPEHGWQDFMQRLAHGLRRVAIQYPHTFPLVASRPPSAPWIRPPLRSLRWIDDFLSALLDAGFSRTAAVDAYRAFTSFLLGHLLLEVAAKGADFGPLADEGPEDSSAELDLTGYPTVDEHRYELAEDHSKREFEESLENLLDRIELLRTQG